MTTDLPFMVSQLLALQRPRNTIKNTIDDENYIIDLFLLTLFIQCIKNFGHSQQFLLISSIRTISSQPHPRHRPPQQLPIAVVAEQTEMRVLLRHHQPKHFHSSFPRTTVLSGIYSHHEQMLSYSYLCYGYSLYTLHTGY